MNQPQKKNQTNCSVRLLALLDHDRWSKISIPALSILLSLAVASAFLLAMGKNPVTAFAGFLQGSGLLPKASYAGGKSMLTDFLSFLDILAPMLLASLGIIITLKAGLFNIGVAGQMLAAGFAATVIVGYSGLGAFIAKPLVILIGIIVGGMMGALVGFLKHKFNIHEVVSTMMFNYIVSFVTGFFINTYFADSITRTSKFVSAASRLTITDVMAGDLKLTLPIGILLAVGAVFLVRFLLDRTVLGFELKTTGSNRNCAKYAGIHVGRTMIIAMALSGVFAGLAGVTYYLGYYNTIIPKTLADLGYDSIAVSLLGNMSPVGNIFASVLITIFQKGSVYMSSSTGVAKEIASVITGILLLFSACSGFIRYLAHRRYEKLFDAHLNKKTRKEAAS